MFIEIYKIKTNKVYPYDKETYISDMEFHYAGSPGRIEFDGIQGQAFIKIFDRTKYAYCNNLPLGSRDACNILRNTSINRYSVHDPPHPWDDEEPIFRMQRDRCGAWHARNERLRYVDLILGPSESISFELLKNAISFLCMTDHTRKKNDIETESLVTFVDRILPYPL